METSLDDINKALSSISRGSFSPLKFQVRRNLDILMPNTIRTLKRKAEEATNLILEGICCHLAFLFKVYFAELISIFFQNVNLTVPLRGFINFFFYFAVKNNI